MILVTYGRSLSSEKCNGKNGEAFSFHQPLLLQLLQQLKLQEQLIRRFINIITVNSFMLLYEYFPTLKKLKAYSQYETDVHQHTKQLYISYFISSLGTGRVSWFMKHSIMFESIIQGSNLETYLKGLHHKNVNQIVNSNSQQ